MLFNSLEFAIFFPIVFLLYWFVVNKNLALRNFFLLVSSYIFYGWWDWRFLVLIFISSSLDYFLGLKIYHSKNESKRKLFIAVTLVTNLGILGYFKYANFFIDSFVEILTAIGVQANYTSLRIILPVGISFYTFQTLSYTLDVYKRKLEPSKDIVAFLAFVSFFPQLVAGPIERASNLLPQFYVKHKFSYEKAKDGTRQILWGLFKKMVIADTCASHVNYIFDNYQTLPASILVLGVIYFAFQIYGDFSGYSDIARGTASLLGFDLMINFSVPYFSRDVAEFWRRWHISLSSWFRDYLYIPLGGSRRTLARNVLNVLIVFTVSGLWHGANWTFVSWGFLNGAFFIPLMLFKRNRKNLDIVAADRKLPNLRELFSMILTFGLICFAWIFFRAENMTQAFGYVRGIFNSSIFTSPGNPNLTLNPLYLIPFLLLIEWINRKKEHQIEISAWHKVARWSFYYALIILLIQFGQQKVSFIYFQF